MNEYKYGGLDADSIWVRATLRSLLLSSKRWQLAELIRQGGVPGGRKVLPARTELFPAYKCLEEDLKAVELFDAGTNLYAL